MNWPRAIAPILSDFVNCFLILAVQSRYLGFWWEHSFPDHHPEMV